MSVCEHSLVCVCLYVHSHGGVGRLQGPSLPSACPQQARVILEKATKVNFKQVDDLASVWCQCGELELRHENYDEALRLLRVRRGPGHRRGQRAGQPLSAPPAAAISFAEGDGTARTQG